MSEPVRSAKGDAKTQLRTFLTSGEFPPGTLLPSENELIELFGFSRYAIREALKELRAGGVIRTETGKGSYIEQAPARYTQRLSIADPADELEPIAPPEISRTVASFVTADTFGIRDRAPILTKTQQHRHRVTGSRVLTIRTLPYEVLFGVPGKPDPAGERKALISVMAEYYGRLTTRDRLRFILNPSAEIAPSLGMPLDKRRPVAETRRLTYTDAGQLLVIETEYTEATALEWEVEH
jgi:DNA-binding GntR family transcriptional regulator